MPEKLISAIPRPQRELYEKGMAAFQRQNYDYAITIFNQVLEKEPGFYDCREALRAVQFKRAGASTGFFKKVFGAASSSPLLARGQIALRRNPLEAVSTAEQILNSDPSNTAGHRLLAEAALAAGLTRTAVLSLEIAFRNSPKDRRLAIELGNALAEAGQISKAESIYSDLLRANPGDQDLSQALKDLSARKTLQEGGYDALADGQGSYRDILRNKGEAVALEQEKRVEKSEDVASRLITEYLQRLEREPDNLKLLRQVAEMYVQRKEYDVALGYYDQLKATEGGTDPSLDKAIAEVRLRKLDHQMAQLDASVPEQAAQIEQIKVERTAFQIAECQKRVERYPTDLAIRFEYGQLCFQAGRIAEAIQEFQKSQANPHLRIQSLSLLGQCFARKGMYELAARTLQNALKEKQVFDDEKKDLIYTFGSVLEKMGRAEEAVKQFEQIYEVDITYKDVAARVDAFYAARANPEPPMD